MWSCKRYQEYVGVAELIARFERSSPSGSPYFTKFFTPSPIRRGGSVAITSPTHDEAPSTLTPPCTLQLDDTLTCGLPRRSYRPLTRVHGETTGFPRTKANHDPISPATSALARELFASDIDATEQTACDHNEAMESNRESSVASPPFQWSIPLIGSQCTWLINAKGFIPPDEGSRLSPGPDVSFDSILARLRQRI